MEVVEGSFKRVTFDLETNGFLEQTTTIHSLVIQCLDTEELMSCTDACDDYPSIEEGLEVLENSEEVWAHNGVKFDYPVLEKLKGITLKGTLRDSLIISRLIYPNLMDKDYRRARISPTDSIEVKRDKASKLGMKLQNFGKHSLEAWGERLGSLKDNYQGGFESWSLEMQDYCEQDVRVLTRLVSLLKSKEYSEQAIDLEHRFAYWIFRQEQHGVLFNTDKAVELYNTLQSKKVDIEEKLQEAFPPWQVKTPFIPKVNNKKLGYKKNVPTYKVREVVFNPSSRHHITFKLKEKYNWKPREHTPSGKAKVDESVLETLPYPEAKLLNEYFLIDKRLGLLANGKNALMKKVRPDGRISAQANTVGAVTRRCTHRVVANIPRPSTAYGAEIRALFTVPEGRVMLGFDASGLELRCLAHYMAKHDDGKYRDVLLEGDIHTVNQEAAGLPTRDNAKTFIYGFLYGAGDGKIGEIVGKGPKEGSRLRQKFLRKTPALHKVIKGVKRKVDKHKSLTAIDGGILHIRSSHSALNTLLQSCGSLIVKQATCLFHEELHRRGYKFGKDYAMVIHYHDELQVELYDPSNAEEFSEVALWALREAGEVYKFRCPIDGEVKVGDTWASTH